MTEAVVSETAIAAASPRRMSKLRRALTLLLPCDTIDGLTLDEMSRELEVNVRTIQRLITTLREEFDVEERIDDDRAKRFFIRESLRRVYTRPTPAEVAALQAEPEAAARTSSPRAAPLDSLSAKVKSALDDRERRRLDVDLAQGALAAATGSVAHGGD